MSIELWLGFVLASCLLLAVPGPTVMLVTGQALAHGRRSALATVPGVALGDLTAISLSSVGLGAVLAASAGLFTLLKLAGAAYLFWLGLKMWRATPPLVEGAPPPPRAARSLFAEAYVVTALNPKSVMFFVAFVPQFLVPASRAPSRPGARTGRRAAEPTPRRSGSGPGAGLWMLAWRRAT